MKNDIRYFIVQTHYNIKNAYALRHSFWVGVVSMIVNDLAFFVIWLLFMQATGPINGWTSIDVFGMLGISMFAFGVSNGIFYGITDLPQFVVRGSFDSVLLSPRNIFLKLSGSSFSITAYGDLLMGFFVVVFYGIYLKLTLLPWLLYIFAIACGCIVFVSMRTLCSLVVFFIHDGDVISRQLFEIFLRPGLYPGSIFPSKLKLFFMTVVPTLITSAFSIYVLKSYSATFLLLGFVMTVLWVLIVYAVFKTAVRRYESGNFLR